MVSQIPRGREEVILKAKILEAKYEAKLEYFLGKGEGKCRKKNFPLGEYGYFLELRIPASPLFFSL